MRRIVEFFQGWYTFPGGGLVVIPIMLAFALTIVGGLGDFTFAILAHYDFLIY